ncbi:hypothetical protein QR680_000155 [Steinernema hermaphroditum]|uniref:Uncharacterized protein n=1 Tax=Steinernema hermaphroditum TaxID=289476 RepID=A0AA39LDL6_9BILA|nr:hypothetical protein QR680_000155 [Steinernema hermaphroditum]
MSFAKKSLLRPVAPATHILYGPRHWEFRASVGGFIDKSINPFVDEWEKVKKFPAHNVFKGLGDVGVFGVNKPVEYGGLGLDFSYSIAVAEELGRVSCAGIPMAIEVQSDMATPALSTFGSNYLKQEFLTPSLSGDLVACLGVSEPSAGSDVAAIKTTARPSGDDLLINGSKQWITNGNQADWICLLANTNNKDSPHRNKSLICVRLDEPGVHRETRIEKLGMHSSDTAEIYFDNVKVPKKNIIGEEGRGFVYQMLQFQDERLVAIAVLLEPMQRCIDLTLEYARTRNAFGKPLICNQTIPFKAVIERLNGADVTVLASMGKLKAGRLARNVTDCCIQYWGGNGYTWDNPVSRFHRDLRLFSIAGGCDEVMLSIIAKYTNMQ